MYALDISDAMLTKPSEKLAKQRIDNVDVLLSQENCIPLNDCSVDRALLVFVAHELNEPPRYLGEIRRVLKSGGRVVVVEPQKGFLGPPAKHRLSSARLNSLAHGAGFQKDRSWWSRSLMGRKYVEIIDLEYHAPVDALGGISEILSSVGRNLDEELVIYTVVLLSTRSVAPYSYSHGPLCYWESTREREEGDVFKWFFIWALEV